MNAQNVSEVTGFCDVKGGKIWYKIIGAEKQAVPLICIHGGPGGSHDYLLTLSSLSSERPVIFYDQLGCGNSDKPSDNSLWTIERYTDELKLLLEHLKYDSVILLGQSWGAVPALEYFLLSPQKVKALIFSGPLISSELFIEGARSYLSSLPDSIRKTIIESEDKQDFTNQKYIDAMNFYYNLHLCRMNPWHPLLLETYGKMNADIYSFMWGPSEFTGTGSLMKYDRTKKLKNITIPILFTCGEYDEAAPYIVKRYSKTTPNSEFVVMKDCSHSHHLENIDEYNYIVKTFINKLN